MLTKVATAQKHVDVIDLCLVRTAINFLIACLTVSYNNKHVINDVPSNVWGILYFRAFMGLVGFTTMVYSIQTIPLFVVTIVFNTSPFWCAFLGYLVLGEKLSWKELGLMMGCFSGVIILALAKGGFFKPGGENIETVENIMHNDFVFGLSAMVFTTWLFSAVTVITRKMRELHFSLLMWHYGFFATLCLLVWVIGEYMIMDDESYARRASPGC